ncbi:MAG TPA: hypothetical protein VK209_00110 [Candidatus Sulfotelmatobacter sp.]|jgi:hypothetical protein|nr:hypothetical protein [Candidatus Sulfotelmatobacter sp.]
MNKVFEKGLEFLKLKEKGLTLYEIMKTLNENSKHKQETSTMM